MQLFHFIIRVPKEHSSFIYFQMEACEGLGFYSTLEFIPGQSFRDIDIKGPIEFKEETLDLLNGLKKSTKLEFLKDEVIIDS
ncbi:MAG: hypothetical protein DRQ88_10870 [Epsilonproteobacteria bacterium]|nr:MAG: hypothetical protein DRQ89_07955 [Campylobacterota bacterium]RLA64497.1 MAG: hypothetical protein DRQ88_10870 [Campylobacterota bacterium]